MQLICRKFVLPARPKAGDYLLDDDVGAAWREPRTTSGTASPRRKFIQLVMRPLKFFFTSVSKWASRRLALGLEVENFVRAKARTLKGTFLNENLLKVWNFFWWFQIKSFQWSVNQNSQWALMKFTSTVFKPYRSVRRSELSCCANKLTLFSIFYAS